MVRKLKVTNFLNSENSDNFLEMAYNAETKTKAKNYLKKALELDPNNLDAELFLADISAKSQLEFLQKTEAIIVHGNKLMEEQGYFKKACVGDFWLILETRPYMRARYQYAILLSQCRMIKKAITECEEMLKLCKGDNLGVRYLLMHLYTVMEDEKSALKLHKKFELSMNTQFLLPLSILYYKLLDFKKAKKYLLELSETNKDTKEFFKALLEQTLDKFELGDYGYKPFTIEEFIITFMGNLYLYDGLMDYFLWGYDILKNKKLREYNKSNTPF